MKIYVRAVVLTLALVWGVNAVPASAAQKTKSANATQPAPSKPVPPLSQKAPQWPDPLTVEQYRTVRSGEAIFEFSDKKVSDLVPIDPSTTQPPLYVGWYMDKTNHVVEYWGDKSLSERILAAKQGKIVAMLFIIWSDVSKISPYDDLIFWLRQVDALTKPGSYYHFMRQLGFNSLGAGDRLGNGQDMSGVWGALGGDPASMAACGFEMGIQGGKDGLPCAATVAWLRESGMRGFAWGWDYLGHQYNNGCKGNVEPDFFQAYLAWDMACRLGKDGWTDDLTLREASCGARNDLLRAGKVQGADLERAKIEADKLWKEFTAFQEEMRASAMQRLKDNLPQVRENIDAWLDKKIENICTGKRPMDARVLHYTIKEYCEDLKTARNN